MIPVDPDGIAQQYLRSADEMAALFADIPQAVANSLEIAMRCNVQVSLGTYYLPDYPIPGGKTQRIILKMYPRRGYTSVFPRLAPTPLAMNLRPLKTIRHVWTSS